MLAAIFFESAIDALNLQNASGLKGLGLTGSDLPIVDLEHNTQLEWLSITHTHITELILPQRHMINEVTIQPLTTWSTWPSLSQLDYIIGNIYSNARAINVQNGSMYLEGAATSPEADSMLVELEVTYGWNIFR